MASYQCWKCGNRVGQDLVVRASVLSGWSLGRFGPRAYFHRVNLCPACARRKRRGRQVMGAAVAVVAAAVLIAALSHRPTPSAARIVPITATAVTPIDQTQQRYVPGLTPTTVPFGLTPMPRCKPAPCVNVSGLEVNITAFQPDYAPASGGFHIARLVMTYADVQGEHGYNPPDDIVLLDPTGAQQDALGPLNQLPAGCKRAEVVGGTLAPGGHAGPFQLCFDMGGPVSGHVVLMYNAAPTTCEAGDISNARPSRTGSLYHDNVYGCEAVLVGLR